MSTDRVGSDVARRILVAFGTRPEFVKLAPVVRALKRAGHAVRTLATGQHSDASMSDVFFSDLDVWPDERWDLEGDTPRRLGRMTELAEQEMRSHPPQLVLLLGDTNTIPVFCLAARRAAVPVAHLEAGLRSFNETSVEEVNRRVGAVCARLQLAPTVMAEQFLLAEGIARERIRVVGNPIIDLLVSLNLERVPPTERSGVLVTAHRPTNVDDPARLADLVDVIRSLAKELDTVTFPVHPRTAGRLAEQGLMRSLEADGVNVSPPLAYPDMLRHLSRSRVIVTDSGGVQEEASFFGVPTVVLRRSTPRWEGVLLGSSRLVGMDAAEAVRSAVAFAGEDEQRRVFGLECPYGDGTTSDKVAALLSEEDTWTLLSVEEPSLELPQLVLERASVLGAGRLAG